MRGPYSVLQHGAEVRPFLVGEVGPYGANMAFRSSALKNFRFDTRLGPIQTQVLPADDQFVTRLRSAGHRGVWSRASMPTTTSSPHKRVRSCTPVPRPCAMLGWTFENDAA